MNANEGSPPSLLTWLSQLSEPPCDIIERHVGWGTAATGDKDTQKHAGHAYMYEYVVEKITSFCWEK